MQRTSPGFCVSRPSTPRSEIEGDAHRTATGRAGSDKSVLCRENRDSQVDLSHADTFKGRINAHVAGQQIHSVEMIILVAVAVLHADQRAIVPWPRNRTWMPRFLSAVTIFSSFVASVLIQTCQNVIFESGANHASLEPSGDNVGEVRSGLPKRNSPWNHRNELRIGSD